MEFISIFSYIKRKFQKMKKVMLMLLLALLFLTGCSIADDDPDISHKVEFKKDSTIEYNKNMDSSAFLVSVDNISINKNNKEGNKLYVSNFYILCPTIKDSIGTQKLTYEIGKETYDYEITVQDTTAPVLTLTKEEYQIKEGAQLKLSSIQYTVSDNYSKKENIKVELEKANSKYELKATDEYGNTIKKEIKVTIKRQKKLTKEKDQTTKKNANDKSKQKSKTESNTKSNYKPKSKTFLIKNYKTFDQCYQKCNAYVNRCISRGFNGKASIVPVKSNGVYVGYKAVFY